MKNHFAAFFLLLTLNGLSAQVCNVTSTTFDICTQCATGTNPAVIDGVFRGQLNITTGVSFTLPLDCGPGISFAADVSINIDNKSRLTIPGELYVEGNTRVTVSGHNNGDAIFNGGTYSPKGGTGGTYADLSAILSTPDGNARGSDATAALPVQVTDWKASLMPAGVLLEWNTVLEDENDYFVVEHSDDGIDFHELTRVGGQGNSKWTVPYAYFHTTPRGGMNYYRLLQVDYSGYTSYHGIVCICTDLSRFSTSVYPNPARAGDVVRVEGISEGTLEVHSLQGHRVATPQVSSDGGFILPSNLRRGTYLISNNEFSHLLTVQ